MLRSPADGRFPVAAAPGGTVETTRNVAGRMADAVLRTGGGRGRRRTSETAARAAEEKELLGALKEHGELTVAGAALETSLTVEEADGLLSALAAKGYLEVRVERGRLLYSLWEVD